MKGEMSMTLYVTQYGDALAEFWPMLKMNHTADSSDGAPI